MRQQTITVGGNLTADPELRFTPSGKAVANFNVVVNSRKLDRQTNEWSDGTPTFWRCQLWGTPAENLAESLTRGMRVLVTGRIETREWEDRTTGEKRTGMELIVDELGASLQFATAKITKATRTSGSRPQTSATGDGPSDDDEPPF